MALPARSLPLGDSPADTTPLPGGLRTLPAGVGAGLGALIIATDDGQPRGTNRPSTIHPRMRQTDGTPRKVLSLDPHEYQTTIPEISAMLYDERRFRAMLQVRLDVVAAWLARAEHLKGCKSPGRGACRCGLDAARCAADSEE